jgi:hypothetical protein
MCCTSTVWAPEYEYHLVSKRTLGGGDPACGEVVVSMNLQEKKREGESSARLGNRH